MAITDTLNLNAQQVADKNPELHQMRQKFFGQDYLSDIQKGDTGTVQYYKGLGDPNAINYTEEQTTQPVVDTSTPVVDTSGGGGGGGQNVVTGGQGDGIMSTAPAMDQAAAIEAMTQPGAYDIPGTMPQTPVSGAWGPMDYLQEPQTIVQDPMTGDASIAEAIAAQDRQDAFDEQFAFEDPKALAARGMGPVDPYGFEDQRSLAARQGVVEPTDPFAFEDARTQQLRGVEPEQILPVAKPEAFDYSTALGDDWALGDEVQPAVTEIEGPTPTQTEYRDPIMDMVAAEKPGMLGDEGFSNLDPETKENTNMIAGLWDKAKGSATNFKNMLTESGKFNPMQILSLGNAFAGSGGALSLASGLGIPGMIIGALSKAGTQVSPEQKAANAAFEQEHGIEIGDDGRITSGPLAGTNPAGKSFAGSATYDEMIDKKIDSIKTRKADQTPASEKKIAELEAMKTTKAAPTGIMKPGGYPGETIPTEETIDDTDLMNFDNLGGWLGRDDVTPETTAPTGIEGPPSEISGPAVGPTGPIMRDVAGPAEPTGGPKGPPSIVSRDPTGTPRGGGADVQAAPTRTAPSAPSDGGFGDRPGPRGGSPSKSAAPGTGARGPAGGGGGGSNGCFLKGTQVTMADGSTKAVEQVDLGDKVAEGGKVFATGKFLVENLYDYKGIKVSGSHMVNEEDKWTRIEDSKQGKSLGDDEHIVYVFGSENRRILIKGILFTDYFEVKEQEKFLENKEDFFKNWKKFSKEDHKSNVNILNAG